MSIKNIDIKEKKLTKLKNKLQDDNNNLTTKNIKDEKNNLKILNETTLKFQRNTLNVKKNSNEKNNFENFENLHKKENYQKGTKNQDDPLTYKFVEKHEIFDKNILNEKDSNNTRNNLIVDEVNFFQIESKKFSDMPINNKIIQKESKKEINRKSNSNLNNLAKFKKEKKQIGFKKTNSYMKESEEDEILILNNNKINNNIPDEKKSVINFKENENFKTIQIDNENKINKKSIKKKDSVGNEDYISLTNSREIIEEKKSYYKNESSINGFKKKDFSNKNVNVFDKKKLLKLSSDQFEHEYFSENDYDKKDIPLKKNKKFNFAEKFENDYLHSNSNNKKNGKKTENDDYYNFEITNHQDITTENINFSEHSIFFHDDFFKNEIFLKKIAAKIEETNTNKEELVIQKKLMYYYLYPRKNVAMPKFMKISSKEKKCQEIIGFREAKVQDQVFNFYDEYPCLKIRKFYFKISEIIKKKLVFVKNPIFDNISLVVILANTVIILISDPLDSNSLANSSDQYFLYIYSIEMIMKILAYGFVVPPNSYFKDLWNILDFLVIFVGWISFFLEKSSGGQKISGLSGLRAFRILRPLKTIKSIKGLRRIIGTLLESMLALGDIVIVLFFFFLIFAIAGVQMWQGLFLSRCHSFIYGFPLPIDDYQNMCTNDSDCMKFNNLGERFYCAKTFVNPNTDVTSYDNLLNAIITVFIIATMEGWTDIFNYVSQTFKDSYYINSVIIFAYFHVLLFVGGYYLINLYLAVINTKYSEIESKNKKKRKKEILSLYSILMETFKIDKDENENENKEDVINEDDQIKKIKDEVNLFDDNAQEIPVSYEHLTDIFVLKTYTPKELYHLKQLILLESKKTLKEYKLKIAQMKKPGNSSSNSINTNKITKNKTVRAGSATKEKFKSLGFRNKSVSHLVHHNAELYQEIIAPSVIKTIEKFEEEVVQSNLEVEIKKNKKKINMENKNKKLQEFFKDKIKQDIEIQDSSDSDQDNNINNKKNKSEDEVEQSENTQAITKKFTGITDKKTTDEEDKKNDIINNELTFSINTSDDSSYSCGYINQSLNIEKKTIPFDNYELEEKLKNIKNAGKKKNILVKKTLINEENELYNKMIITKPSDDPLISISKYKEENIIKKKKEAFKNNFTPNDREDNFASVYKKNLGRNKSFLNFLKNTEELTEQFKKVSVEEMKQYENQLNNKSLDISRNNIDLELIIESKSEIEDLSNNSSNLNKECDKFEDFDDFNLKLDENKFTRLLKGNIPENYKNKRNSCFFSSNGFPIQMDKNNDFYHEFNKAGKDSVNKINNIVNCSTSRLDDMLTINQKNLNGNFRNIMHKKSNYKYECDTINFDDYNFNKYRKNKTKKRSKSINKTEYKYAYLINIDPYSNQSNTDLVEKEEKKFENLKVLDHLTLYRKYMKYMNIIINKDFKVLDNFSVDDFAEDVMGKTENNIEIKPKNVEIDPIKIFNRKILNLKTNRYIKYIPNIISKDDLIEIKNNLKYLSFNILNNMDLKTKDFRNASEYYKLKKNIKNTTINLNGNTTGFKKSIKLNTDRLSKTRSMVNSNNTIHRSFSVISNSSSKKIKRNVLNEIQKIKEKNMMKIYSDFLKLSTENKIIHLLDKDKINLKNDFIPKIVIDLETKQEDIRNKIDKIRKYDLETNSRKYKEWSGHQVMEWVEDPKKYSEWNKLILSLEEMNIILWQKNILKHTLKKCRYFLFMLSINPKFDFFILSVVFCNILIMLLSGNLLDPTTLKNIQISNYAFNSIFMFEFLCKFIGLGPIIYFSDPFTYLDLAIIGFAILDMSNSSAEVQDITITPQNKNIASQLSFIRVFRIFRIMRIAKILRKIKSFKKILVGISNSLSNVAYNSLILLIFIIIFQLLGMSLLNFDSNYQSFLSSLYITFQILTIENWNSVLYKLSEYNRLSVLYLVVLIFIGNYILFNLFISILLNSFDNITEIQENPIDENLPDEFVKYELIEREMKSAKKDPQNKDKNEYKDDYSDDDEDEEEEEGKSEMIETSYSNFLGVQKFVKDRSAVFNIFKGNECEYSLFYFSQISKVRLFCKNIVSLKKFDQLILLMILLSTLRLIIDTFLSGALSVVIFDAMDIVFTLIFLTEMILKTIAFGFVLGEGSYLKDNWNRIDFVIVVVSIIDLQNLISKYTGKTTSSSLNFLKVLRLLRTLRPLRFISHNVQLKIIITALLDSIGPIANVLIIVIIILIIFSIIGMNLFYELYHTCYIGNSITPFAPVLNFTDYLNFTNPQDYNKIISLQQVCNSLGGSFDASPSFQFSNIFTSLITSYVLANGEGWSDVMNSYRAFNEYFGLFFIIFFLTVTNFFFNLFVGVMFSSFNDAWNKENKKEITENSGVEQYWDFLKQIEISVPEWSTFKKPDKGFRKIVYNIMQSKIIDNFIIFIIVSNMVTMAIDYQGSPPGFTSVLDTLNLVFTGIFIVECILKLIANGISGYFYYGWNKFDFFVVASSVLDLIMTNTNKTNISFLKSFQIIRVLRVLRVTRVLRLVKSLRGLEKLLQTLRWSINALANVFILMFLIFCIFAIIGCYLFEGISFKNHSDKFQYYNQYFNFDNFISSFLLCFRSVTGENWPLMMIEISNECYMDSVEDKKLNLHNKTMEDEDKSFLKNHHRYSTTHKKGGRIIPDQIDVLKDFEKNLDSYTKPYNMNLSEKSNPKLESGDIEEYYIHKESLDEKNGLPDNN